MKTKKQIANHFSRAVFYALHVDEAEQRSGILNALHEHLWFMLPAVSRIRITLDESQ